MKQKHRAHHFWLILGAYGVWFALFSGISEVFHGIYWKFFVSLILGILTYFVIEVYFDR